MQSDISNSTVFLKRTTRKFRDVSAWYHICVAIDLTQSNADKIKGSFSISKDLAAKVINQSDS